MGRLIAILIFILSIILLIMVDGNLKVLFVLVAYACLAFMMPSDKKEKTKNPNKKKEAEPIVINFEE